MIHTFNNKQITGILTILPSKEVSYELELNDYHFLKTKVRDWVR